MDIKVGLDLSINSTGICINTGDKQVFYIITNKTTQKGWKLFESMDNPPCHVIVYDKEEFKGLSYQAKESIKTNNYLKIANHIIQILKNHDSIDDKIICYIEGVSFGTTGSSALMDLVGLNFVVRTRLMECGYPFLIVSPTDNKKVAVGNGQATKDLMVYSFVMLHPEMGDFDKVTKIDDVADAYFLSTWDNL